MDLRTVLIVSIIISLSSCTLAERFQNKIDQNKEEPQVVQENTSVKEPSTPAPPKISNYDHLNQTITQQQKQLQQLEELQANDRVALQRLEQKLLTNFELLERSVSDSLAEIDQQIRKLTVSLNQVQTQLRRQNSTTQSSETTPRQSQTSSAGHTTDRQTTPNPEMSKKLIENYSLFSSKKAPSSSKKKQISPPQEEPSENKQLVPLPPPSEDQLVDETRPVRTSKIKEVNQIAKASERDAHQTFTDPFLMEPNAPYKLKKRPQVRKLYDQGLDAMINHKYQEAIQTFQDMLKQFPDDEYSDNAMFWLGHVHFSLNRLDQAEESFHKVLSDYEHRPTTQGYKTPDAIYMLGKISKSRNDKVKSEYYFNEVIKRFPGSTAASNAEEELKTLTEKP